ncbi:DUF4158 domain-containing protein [Nocardia sp. NPDC005998]|uniref:DUF4158 domain-containing protein n=1 Tax=Nocardia sp. NPDC005998 TaxID=3156894 RepID=UPI0033A4C5A6
MKSRAYGHQVGVARTEIAFYEWSGRTNTFHRNQIRGSLGFRECSVADADAVTDWLVAQVTQSERSADQVRARLLAHLRAEWIEPPTGGRIDRVVRSALSRGEELLFERVASRLPDEAAGRMVALIGVGGNEAETEDGPTVFAAIRSDPGAVSLNTMTSQTVPTAAPEDSAACTRMCRDGRYRAVACLRLLGGETSGKIFPTVGFNMLRTTVRTPRIR